MHTDQRAGLHSGRLQEGPRTGPFFIGQKHLRSQIVARHADGAPQIEAVIRLVPNRVIPIPARPHASRQHLIGLPPDAEPLANSGEQGRHSMTPGGQQHQRRVEPLPADAGHQRPETPQPAIRSLGIVQEYPVQVGISLQHGPSVGANQRGDVCARVPVAERAHQRSGQDDVAQTVGSDDQDSRLRVFRVCAR
jgi:hypothetical protein